METAEQYKGYFKEHLNKFSYQRILSTRGKHTLNISQLKIMSAIVYSKFPPKQKRLQKVTGLCKQAISKNLSVLRSLDLIDKQNRLTPNFHKQAWLVRKESRLVSWKLLRTKELPELENRVFSMLVSFCKTQDLIVKKSISSITRLCGSTRFRTRLALKSLKEKGLIKIGQQAIKLCQPPIEFWELKKMRKTQIIKEQDFNSEEGVKKIINKIAAEQINWFIRGLEVDGKKSPLAFTYSVFKAFKKQGLEFDDAYREMKDFAVALVDHLIKFNLTEKQYGIWMGGTEAEEWTNKILSGHDPKRGELNKYLLGCIQKLK